jgi:hypothetical protein
MIGLFFLLSFSSITIFQMIGMCFHRWQTRQSTSLPILSPPVCHYIASTKLNLFGGSSSAEDELKKVA